MIALSISAAALLCQIYCVWLGSRIARLDQTYWVLTGVLILMAARQGTAMTLEIQSAAWGSLLGRWDRALLPLIVTMGVVHFMQLQSRRYLLPKVQESE